MCFFIISCNITYFYFHNEETAQQRLSQHVSGAVQLNFFFIFSSMVRMLLIAAAMHSVPIIALCQTIYNED